MSTIYIALSVCLFVCLSVCLFVCLSVCLFVCLSVQRNLRGLKSYDHKIWHVGPFSDRNPLRSIIIFRIFGRRPFLWAQTPFFGFFWVVQRLRVVSSSNLESRISGSLPNMWNHQMFQKSIFSTRARDHFWRDMGANPVFRTFLFEVVWWWNLVCRYSMWPGVWMSEPNFDFRPWAFLWARTPFFGLFGLFKD